MTLIQPSSAAAQRVVFLITVKLLQTKSRKSTRILQFCFSYAAKQLSWKCFYNHINFG